MALHRLGILLVLALVLAPAASAGEASSPPVGATEAPPPDCALYSLEGIRLGATSEEARAARPDICWRVEANGEVTGGSLMGEDVDRVSAWIEVRDGRVSGLVRRYHGMSQAGVRERFLERFGPPSRRKEAHPGASSSAGLERTQLLTWSSETCNVRLTLDIHGEEDWRGPAPPAATATMERLTVPVNAPKGPANVKF